MELYYDGWCVIKVNYDKNCAIYADAALGYCEMSINVAKYIVKKLAQDMKLGYDLLALECERWKHYCDVIAKEVI